MTAPAQPKANGQAHPVPALPPAPAPVDVPVEVTSELLELALGTDAGQRIWRVWCRTTPAVRALGQIAVRINPGAMTVASAAEPPAVAG